MISTHEAQQLFLERNRLLSEIKYLKEVIVEYQHDTTKSDYETLEHINMRLSTALELIASPMRPDGTWNRDRKACQILALEALSTPTEKL